MEVISKFNSVYIDQQSNRPLQNIRIKHTLVIDEGGFPDEEDLHKFIPSRSPSPVRVDGGERKFLDDDVNIEKIISELNEEEIAKQTETLQTKSRA